MPQNFPPFIESSHSLGLSGQTSSAKALESLFHAPAARQPFIHAGSRPPAPQLS